MTQKESFFFGLIRLANRKNWQTITIMALTKTQLVFSIDHIKSRSALFANNGEKMSTADNAVELNLTNAFDKQNFRILERSFPEKSKRLKKKG